MNIVYIHTHDSGRILSPYGYAVPTPNLSDFCGDSLLFRQAYSAAPTCSPSRAGLLTGMYPHACGMLGLAQRGFALKDASLHLVSHLKEQGFHTALCGIQHESGSYLKPQDGAFSLGYHESIGTDPSPYKEEDLCLWDRANAREASQWLKGYKSSKPFFLSMGFFSTHRKFPEAERINSNNIMPPYPVPDTAEARGDFTRYQTSAAYFDEAFGQIIASLKEAGHYENSLIIFTTDHGIAYPYAKGSMFDTGIGVALALRIPHGQRGVCDHLVSQVDIFPTLCDILGIPKPNRLQGQSFAPLLEGKACPLREDIFAEFNFHTSYEPMRCIRTRRYKYIRCYDRNHLRTNPSNTDNSPVKEMYLNEGFALRPKAEEALYDLFYDPGERCNEAANPQYASVLADMKDRLTRYQKETGDPLLEGPITVQPHWKVNRPECINPSSKDPSDYL